MFNTYSLYTNFIISVIVREEKKRGTYSIQIKDQALKKHRGSSNDNEIPWAMELLLTSWKTVKFIIT